jgi:hypothetical protein
MKNLTISQNGSDYAIDDDGNFVPSFSFDAEFWEHTPPVARTLKGRIKKLFPATNPKPPVDSYKSQLKYKNEEELYQAVIT